MNSTAPIQTTDHPRTETLDTLLQKLCNTHGLPAVGESLARLHGRTQAIQAILGQLPPTATGSTLSDPSATTIPANTTWAAPKTS